MKTKKWTLLGGGCVEICRNEEMSPSPSELLFDASVQSPPSEKTVEMLHFSQGAYHLTENFGNSGWKVNGKVTFRNFQPKIEEYVLR